VAGLNRSCLLFDLCKMIPTCQLRRLRYANFLDDAIRPDLVTATVLADDDFIIINFRKKVGSSGK
jgi:hypothetical protein